MYHTMLKNIRTFSKQAHFRNENSHADKIEKFKHLHMCEVHY